MLAGDRVYDICFVDWKMPEMSGIDFARKVRANGLSKPIIVVLSAYDWNTIENEAKAAGVDGFLSKPLFPSDLVDCVNRFIGSKNSYKPETPQDEEALSFKGFHILLAEDVEINREIVLSLLESTQIEIDCAENGMEAVRLFSASPDIYDLILMDVQMPEMDGLTATRNIRALDVARAQDITIVAMTANVFREDVERCLEAGMNDHIGKPIDYNDMISKLKQYLGN